MAVVARALVCALAGTSALACESASPPASTPGLGEIMAFNQLRHIKLWYAGEAGNWPLAGYEIDELGEGFDDVVRFHPGHERTARPLSELVPEFTAGPLRDLRAAVRREDHAAFVVAYDTLTNGCNACHEAAGFSFNVITRPTSNPYSDQRFRLTSPTD